MVSLVMVAIVPHRILFLLIPQKQDFGSLWEAQSRTSLRFYGLYYSAPTRK